MPDHHATESHPLPLPAGQRARGAVEILVQAQGPGDLGDTLVDVGFRFSPGPGTEGQVLVDGHVRVQRVALEDHGHVAFPRRHQGDVVIVDRDAPVGGGLQSGEHAQGGALAAP